MDAGAFKPIGGNESDAVKFVRTLLLGPRHSGEERGRFEDQKRTLLGRLLALRACAMALGHPDFTNVKIGRTRGMKPFLQSPLPEKLPNFNFNVSHDGRWVVLVADPLRLCGVDVSAPQLARGDREDDSWFEDLESILYESEKQVIGRGSTVQGRYELFQRMWSAKESVTKAVGQGLSFGMERIEVTLDPSGLTLPPEPKRLKCSGAFSTALALLGTSPAEAPEPVQKPTRLSPCEVSQVHVSIDHWPRPEWWLEQEALPGNHWVTTAAGPPEEAVDADGAFVATMRLRDHRGLDQAVCRARAVDPLKRFEILKVEELLPPSQREVFLQLQDVGSWKELGDPLFQRRG